jgi:hypothetical protein
MTRKLSSKQSATPEVAPAVVLPKKKSWTIMLYIAADGTLANFAVESLKQLKNSASKHGDPMDQASVIVAAQFAVDAPGGQQIPRYIFQPGSSGNLGANLVSRLSAPRNTTEQVALTKFLQWAYANCHTEKYALILWGHGPELLLQPTAGAQTDDSSSSGNNGTLYISPEELRVAIEEGTGGKKLDIIGFDACSMDMFEVAYELSGLVDYMVASQEEVPDLSFPYDTLVELFRKLGNEEETLLKLGVNAYVQTYQDYICNDVTGMKQTTLSALRLKHCQPLADALKALSAALYAARHENDLPDLLIDARSKSRDFVVGLYVDLGDFSRNLSSVLEAGNDITWDPLCPPPAQRISAAASGKQHWREAILSACKSIEDALREDTCLHDKQLFILANRSADDSCRGISLYFPYLTKKQYVDLGRPLVKGTPTSQGLKDFSTVLNQAGSTQLMNARNELISDTEGHYEYFRLAHDTCWYRFIVEQWSRILIEKDPHQLDMRYSAEQCAINVCRKLDIDPKNPCQPHHAITAQGKTAPI